MMKESTAVMLSYADFLLFFLYRIRLQVGLRSNRSMDSKDDCHHWPSQRHVIQGRRISEG
jgi:hypothetical protein